MSAVSLQNLPPNIKVRYATPADAPALGALFFTSFSPTHPFWDVLIPQDEIGLKWFIEAFRVGIEDDPTALTLLAEDASAGRKVIAFARWIVPQADGNTHRLWPELPSQWDMDIVLPFFGGMEENRDELMGTRPHWMFELLGVDVEYQGKGIGRALTKWGCDQADEQGLEVYLDASMKGAPLYQKYYGFQPKKPVVIPDRPDSYGKYVYISHVRPVMNNKAA